MSYWLTPGGSTACVSCTAGQYAYFADRKCYACEPGSYQSVVPTNWAPARFSISSSANPGCCDAVYDITDGRFWGIPIYMAAEAGPCQYLWWTNYWFKGFHAFTASDYIDPATGQVYACTMNAGLGTRDGPYPDVMSFLYSRSTILSKCPACPIGTYAPNSGASACLNCEAGTFSATIGASAPCAPCAAGFSTGGATGRSQCLQCPSGTAADKATRASVCVTCTSGTFSQVNGSTTCTACAGGTYASTTSQTTCQFCLAGSYVSVATATACILCPAGTFAHTFGVTACAPCPDGTGSYTGASACVSCV